MFLFVYLPDYHSVQATVHCIFKKMKQIKLEKSSFERLKPVLGHQKDTNISVEQVFLILLLPLLYCQVLTHIVVILKPVSEIFDVSLP